MVSELFPKEVLPPLDSNAKPARFHRADDVDEVLTTLLPDGLWSV